MPVRVRSPSKKSKLHTKASRCFPLRAGSSSKPWPTSSERLNPCEVIMDVNIDEMTSTVRVTDEQTLLNRRVMEQIIRNVLARLKDEEDRARPLEEDRELRPSVSGRPAQNWTP